MAALPEDQHGRAQLLSRQQAQELFDRAARRYLGVSGEEFIRRWDAGEYRENADTPPVSTVAMLLPFGR